MNPSDYGPVPAELRDRNQNAPWAQELGIRYHDLRRGYCRVSLEVAPHMVNFQGHPHGGVLFTLADVAFGAACNSHGGAAVALNMTISYLTAVRPGTTLIAEGRARKQGRRAGFYDIEVSAADGTRVALVHCVAHRVS